MTQPSSCAPLANTLARHAEIIGPASHVMQLTSGSTTELAASASVAHITTTTQKMKKNVQDAI